MMYFIEKDDSVMAMVCGLSCNLVSLYLCASYTYSHALGYILSDTDYDKLCFKLIELKDNDKIKNHQHFNLIDFDALKCSTGYDKIEYPQSVIGSAMTLLECVENPEFRAFMENYSDKKSVKQIIENYVI